MALKYELKKNILRAYYKNNPTQNVDATRFINDINYIGYGQIDEGIDEINDSHLFL